MSKVTLVTGASSGIGKSIAETLQQSGYTVYGTSRNPDTYPDSNVHLLPLDVCKQHSVDKCLEMLGEKAGRLDVLINNAGKGITGPMEETPIEEVEAAFATNFFGPLRVINASLPLMRQSGGGKIINITSIAGFMGLPFRGIYSASKGALNLTTEAYRLELRSQNIHMSNLAPGDFATNIAAGRYHAEVNQDGPYAEAYARTLKLIDQHVDEAGDPEEVAQKILEILNEEKPRANYKVGSLLQKFSISLKRALSQKRFEKMLAKHYKL